MKNKYAIDNRAAAATVIATAVVATACMLSIIEGRDFRIFFLPSLSAYTCVCLLISLHRPSRTFVYNLYNMSDSTLFAEIYFLL